MVNANSQLLAVAIHDKIKDKTGFRSKRNGSSLFLQEPERQNDPSRCNKPCAVSFMGLRQYLLTDQRRRNEKKKHDSN